MIILYFSIKSPFLFFSFWCCSLVLLLVFELFKMFYIFNKNGFNVWIVVFYCVFLQCFTIIISLPRLAIVLFIISNIQFIILLRPTKIVELDAVESETTPPKDKIERYCQILPISKIRTRPNCNWIVEVSDMTFSLLKTIFTASRQKGD